MYLPYKYNYMFCYKSIRKRLTLKEGTSSDSIDLSIRGLFQIPQDKEFEIYDEEGNKLGIPPPPRLNNKIIYVTIKGEPSNIKKKISLKIKVRGQYQTRINVESSDTIENVKKIIFEEICIMPGKLYTGSSVLLEDSKTINDYGIKDEDVLYMREKKENK